MDRRTLLRAGGLGVPLLVGAALARRYGVTSSAVAPEFTTLPGDQTTRLIAPGIDSANVSTLQTGATAARVIVIGGGMAGATVAKYLRLWGPQLEVTLIERAAFYTSNIMSSMVLTGQRSLSSLQYKYDTLVSRYGVKRVTGDVTRIDAGTKQVTLADGRVFSADRLVLAPGIAFDEVPGLTDPLVMPHAWAAGPQTTVLAQQLSAMPSNGILVLTIPPVPYRCPPGPYERACLLADWLRQRKPQAKLIILDANPDIIVEKENFSAAFSQLYARNLEYRPGVIINGVDMRTRTLFTNVGDVRGDVINLIPRQKAPPLISGNSLANDPSGRFAKVNMIDYSSTVAPGVHIIGDSSATTQPKAGHIANQEAKVCADAIIRSLGGLMPDPDPITTSSCFSTITMTKASWLHGMFRYNPVTQAMAPIASAAGVSSGWSGNNFDDMNIWFKSLMADSFA